MKWITRNSLLWLTTVLLPCTALATEPLEATTEPSSRTAATSGPKTYAPYPEPEVGYVTDKAGLLTPQQKDKLNAYCYTTEKNTNVEVVVVTIESIKDYPGTANASIEDFAHGLFDKYGIGNLPKNDGVLLLVARQDRKVRIELGKSYGHSRDSDSQRIIDNEILPQFRNNDYAAGITNGTRAIIKEFADIQIRSRSTQIILVLVAVALIPVCVSLFRRGKRGWGWVVLGIIIVLIVFALKTTGKVIEALPKGSSAGGFGGGFGGGSSGGGGATGSW